MSRFTSVLSVLNYPPFKSENFPPLWVYVEQKGERADPSHRIPHGAADARDESMSLKEKREHRRFSQVLIRRVLISPGLDPSLSFDFPNKSQSDVTFLFLSDLIQFIVSLRFTFPWKISTDDLSSTALLHFSALPFQSIAFSSIRIERIDSRHF
jgi:hypothetical protein